MTLVLCSLILSAKFNKKHSCTKSKWFCRPVEGYNLRMVMTTFGSQNNCSNVRAHFVRTPVKPISLIPETNPYSIWWDGHLAITFYVLSNFNVGFFRFHFRSSGAVPGRNLSVAPSITIWNQIPKRIRIIVVLEMSRDQLIDRIC